MADLKAEQIIAAVIAVLDATATAGANVIRGQLYQSYASQLPGIAVYMGADEPEQESTQALVDWYLQIKIQIRAETNTSLESTISLIRKEIHIALMADPTFALGFVRDTVPGIANEPVLSGEGETPIGIQDLVYEISYRAARNDLSA